MGKEPIKRRKLRQNAHKGVRLFLTTKKYDIMYVLHEELTGKTPLNCFSLQTCNLTEWHIGNKNKNTILRSRSICFVELKNSPLSIFP